MINDLNKIILVIPDLLLLIGSLSVIMHSVFSNPDKDYIPIYARYIFFGILLTVLCVNWKILDTPHLLLKAYILQNRMIVAAKILTVLLSFPFWGMKHSMLYEAFGRARLQFYEYTALIFISLLGTFLLLEANNWLLVYLALELQVLPWYIILSYRHEKPSFIESGIKYFIFGSIASAMILYGIAFIFGSAGTLYFTSISLNTWGLVGVSCIFSGILMKLAVAPVHLWATEVYEGGDNIQIGYLATIPLITFLIFLLGILKGPFNNYTNLAQEIFSISGCCSIIIGSFGALKQKNLRKLLAYSGFVHIGLIMLLMPHSPKLIIVYMLFYTISTMFLYVLISMVYRSTNNIDFIKDLNGIGAFYPLLAFSLAICILSLSGIPPFPGFWAKLPIFLSFIHNKQYAFLLIAVISNLIAIYYYLQIIRHIYLTPEEIEHPQSEIYGHFYVQSAILIFTISFFLGLDKLQNFIGELLI